MVGEARLGLSNVGKLRQLEKKVALVKMTFTGNLIPLLITQSARSQVLEVPGKKGSSWFRALNGNLSDDTLTRRQRISCRS